MKLTDKVTELRGVGPKKAKIFKDYGIETIEDLTLLFPRGYQDRRHSRDISDLSEGETVLIEAAVISRQYRGGHYKVKAPLKLLVKDESGTLEVVFFNGKYLYDYFKIDKKYSFYGKITANRGIFQMTHPEFHKAGDEGDTRGILAVYPGMAGISQNELRKLMTGIKPLLEEAEEWLPESIIEANNLASLKYALTNIHFPKDSKSVLISKFRFIFEEFLALEIGLLFIKNGENSGPSGVVIDTSHADEFKSRMKFKLTSGQEKSWQQVAADLDSEKKMNRLIQGDVGSGKTAVAEIAMYSAVKSGYQAVMMSPTEILAKQHLETLRADFNPYNINIGLLCSSMKANEKKRVLEALEKSDIQILVGTHAVIQPSVIFNNLGLIITDEQHRFGVNQRKLLSAKGDSANVMVMTATPIPRTLAVVLYGDLDVSVIDTMPEGRKTIITKGISENKRNEVYDFVEKQIESGRQAFVVAPLIEDSENVDARSADAIFEELKDRFKKHNVAIIHGSMKQEEKDSVMELFSTGNIDILVSTVIVEVGINVPNATVMVIENSERFGLAQMHQLRGRIGRGKYQSYCFLICESKSEVARERLKVMCQSNDGFYIAEEDLKLRGPGEVFGTRQHGLPEMQLSDLVRHVDVLEQAKKVASDILKSDPKLICEANRELKRRTEKLFGGEINLQL